MTTESAPEVKTETAPATEVKTEAPATEVKTEAAPAVKTEAPATEVKTEAPVVPEKYDFKMPEGVTLDGDVVGAFEGVAKELGLPQDKAQLVIDKVAPAMHARAVAAQEAVKAEMLAAAQADKEIGGEKFAENVAVAKTAVDAYFSPEFKKFLDETGLGNHPEMIRGMFKIGATLKQDTHVNANKNPVVGGDARKFYPNSTMQA